ncbi:MAG TPA: CDP-alcohol phosphatidyltransferase family protein [Candidatus Kapabacteria bacterium]|nr:CDP-alcohol phosphatidyltransferase family protein [Candidatus Kapabacteria bacterium]
MNTDTQNTATRKTEGLNLRWTLSNALSALRIVLVIPMALAIANDMRALAAVICVAAAATDVLDGYLARRWNEISDLGKILDPLADKVFVGVLVILLLLHHMLAPWVVIAVLARDLAIFLGGIVVERRTRQVLPSNYPGKIAVLSLSTTLFMIILAANATAIQIMLWISLALLALSFVLYVQRAVSVWTRGAVG